MYLLLSIILSVGLGVLLMFMGPVVGGFLAFGIVVGTLFRILFLLNDIHKWLLKVAPKADEVKEAYESYVKEKETKDREKL